MTSAKLFSVIGKIILNFYASCKKCGYRYYSFSTFTKLWLFGPTTFSEKRMTHLLALISQSKNPPFPKLLIWNLNIESNMNQCCFLPHSPNIFSKLPSLRQRFPKRRLSFCLLPHEGFVNSILPDAEMTRPKLYSHWIEEVCSSLASLKGLKGKKTKFSWLVDGKKAKSLH